MRDRVATAARWLTAPATDEAPRGHATAAAFLRILLGLMWLYNVYWKRPPGFGEATDSGLYHFTSFAVSHPVLPPFSWVVEHVVLPNIAIFGWGVIVAETALAVLLLTGAWTRAAAALGIAQSLAIGLSVAYAPHEWPWSYWLMVGAHLLLLFSAAGRVVAVDAVRADPTRAPALARLWGVLAIVVGLVGAARSLGDPLQARGPGLRYGAASVSLGEYNLLGGLVLVAIGVLLVVGSAMLARVAAGLAVLAGLSLHVQIGFSDPILGGTGTTAAVFFATAVVAATTSRGGPRTRPSAERLA